jgi:GGDEF domain-containing protein
VLVVTLELLPLGRSEDATADALAQRADKAMYKANTTGRDRVALAGPTPGRTCRVTT